MQVVLYKQAKRMESEWTGVRIISSNWKVKFGFLLHEGNYFSAPWTDPELSRDHFWRLE